MTSLLESYKTVRQRTENICKPLKTEDYVVQPIVDVSPPKWHLGHTTWFFETFILIPHAKGYNVFDPNYNFVFNSYYETIGARVIRTDRGNLSRPSVEDIYKYRAYVDEAMQQWLSSELNDDLLPLITLGLNHEEQHQELLVTDIKYILGNNPLMPAYNESGVITNNEITDDSYISIPEGVYEVGFEGDGFCFDNELNRHKVYLQNYKIAKHLVTNEAYLKFINNDGYKSHQYWHSEGFEWVKIHHIEAPMYWHLIDDEWHHYTLNGLQPLDLKAPVCHISFYEAAAFAAWKGKRLPTEFEWEIAATQFNWGQRWEWTDSAYLPYPGFKRAEGAIGEYNGKFMVNQMVLRGASEATPPHHSRITYRNFFQTGLRWQYTGIRLAE